MSESQTVRAEPAEHSRVRRMWFRFAVVSVIMLLLFGVPWWTLLAAGTAWPTAVVVIGSVVFASASVGLPLAIMFGHGRSHLDWAAVTADTLLGVVWVLFVWSVLSQALRLTLFVAGVEDPARSRLVAAAVVAVVVALLGRGYVEAMRVPRVRAVDVTLPRLGKGLDGLRVAVLTDTHYGPIDRARWSAGCSRSRNSMLGPRLNWRLCWSENAGN